MNKSMHKIISVVLCVALLFCAMFALTFSVKAASGDTVYVRVPSSWSQAYCYMWNDSGNNAQWPGVKMTATGESGVYSYTLTADYNNIIFNNGSGGVGTNQTGDLTYSNYNGYICDLTGGDITNGSWSQYDQSATQGTTPATPTTPTAPPSGEFTIYLKNSSKWGAPYCYMWNGSGGAGNQNSAWPGAAMTSVGDDVWMYTSSTNYTNVVFSNNGQSQTTDLTAQNGYIFDNQSNSWSIYDTSPLQVKSFTADPDSNIYTGMDVTLAANAVSTEGSVKYRFSVNGTAITAFSSASTATWTPTAAGSYTITFDFKDTAGNENSRTLNLTVSSDSGVAAPIIKKVTPADNGYVQTGTSTTISVTAGGGQTGTNLLFYKYVIVDPSGAQNTAYYTLNKTYSFTFSKNGTYTISVFVQASDNATVSKTFTVTATGTVPVTDPIETDPIETDPIETDPIQTDPPVPTQPTQPTQPATDSGTSYDLGDVNKDGIIDIKDATYFQMYLAEYNGYEVTLELGDVNKDGKLNIRDVAAIQRIVAKVY